MLVTALERERERFFQNGLREGEQKGRIEAAKTMLAKGMELALISEITNLPEAQLLQLERRAFLSEEARTMLITGFNSASV